MIHSEAASFANPSIAWEPYDASKPSGQEHLINVIPNTNYLFSVWVRDLAKKSDCQNTGAPIVGIRVNGVDMGELNLNNSKTAPPCCPDWQELCIVWNSVNATTVHLEIESRSGVGFTDLGIDDVYFGINPLFPSVLGNDTTICSGETLFVGCQPSRCHHFMNGMMVLEVQLKE